MRQIRFDAFPEGKPRAFTASYDDGRQYDARLAELFRAHGIRATFHVNSGFWGTPDYITQEDARTIYRDHEISAHTYTHPRLPDLPDLMILDEILEDKERLEAVAGYPVRGMSYPYGQYDTRVTAILRSAGMQYSRTVAATQGFDLPKDFMTWHPTCHHSANLPQLWDRFLARRTDSMALFYLWGHSYEFDRNRNWEVIETFCKMISGRDDLWYATNIEIYDYVNALRGLVFTSDTNKVYNPSATEVFFHADGRLVRAPGGCLTSIQE